MGNPIVSQSSATSGRAIASGAKRDRGRSTARGAGSRLGLSMYERRMGSCR